MKLPLESTSLFKGLGQCLRISANRRFSRLQVLLQRLHLSTQLWKKDDKLRIKLKEETNTSKAEKVHTEVGVLEDGESLRVPGHLLTQSGVRLLHPHHPTLKREHFLVSLRPGLSLQRQGTLLYLQGLQGTLEHCLSVY